MRTTTWISLLSSVFCLIAAPAFSFAPAGKPFLVGKGNQRLQIEEKVLRPIVDEAALWRGQNFGTEITVKIDTRTGQPRLLSGGEFAAATTVSAFRNVPLLVEACEAVLRHNADDLGIDVADLRLNADAVHTDDTHQFLLFNVTRDGIAVKDADLACRFFKGKLVQIADHSYSEARREPAATVIDSQAALQAIFPEAKLAFIATHYRVVADADTYLLRLVSAYDISAAGMDYVAEVSEDTGEVFQLTPKFQFNARADISGMATSAVYNRYYKDTLTYDALAEVTLQSGATKITTDLLGTFLAPETTAPTLSGFQGTRVNVRVSSGTLVTATAQRTLSNSWQLNYNADPAADVAGDKNMAQAMIFHQVNRIINHSKQFIQPAWFNQQLRANANLTQTCNAHWDGSTINMYSAGSNCANTGLIADVIQHEWGHGLDANTGGISDGAFSEGFGDICAMVMTKSHDLGIGFRTSGGALRDLEEDKIYPRDKGEVHDEGQIIGSTFWDLYKELVKKHGEPTATTLVSKYAFKGIYTAARYTNMYEAILVIDDDDGNTNTPAPNFCLINPVFAKHGLATKSASCPDIP